jgi:glycogen synthase
MYKDAQLMQASCKKMMELDFSWEQSVQQYIQLYQSL